MELTITAQKRSQVGKQNNTLRKTGFLPAVLYGSGKESVNLQVSAKEFEKVYRAAGENTLVNLVVDGDPQKKVLIHDVARHYMKNLPIHVDFYEVDLTKKIHTKVPLVFEGVAPAIKELGGILVRNLNEVEVEALPADLPHSIIVDITKLATFADAVRLQDLRVSSEVKILGREEEVIALVQAPRSEEELAELEKPSAVDAEKQAIEGLTKDETEKTEGDAGEAVTSVGESAEPAKAKEE